MGGHIKIHCLYDQLVSVKELKPHPKNANKHPPDQIKRLAEILDYQGWRYPIKVSKLSGFITSGHGRLEAARINKWNEVPVNYQDYESEDQEIADVHADNAIASWAELDLGLINTQVVDFAPDFNIDLLGVKDFVLEPSEKYDEETEDDIPEKVEPKTKLGDIYILGNHRLLCGDSTNIQHVERLMNGNKADMVFTDPPYGINEKTDRDFASRTRLAKGGKFNKIIGDETIDTAISVYSICNSIAPVVCYWGGNYYAHKLPPSPCWLIWDKRVEEKQRDMNSDCEMAYVKHPEKKSIRIFRHLWKGLIKESERGQKRIHPTQKPIALASWCFDELSKSAKLVVDLFGGSGSTLIACEKTNRNCYTMEIDPHYCDVIVARWEKYTGKKAELSS